MVQFTTYGYRIRVAAILLAAIAPFICIMAQGVMPSLSSYWNTDLQPLFIITNAITSYYLYSMQRWRVSALMLLLLTSFSVDLFKITHDILAIIFFIANLYPLTKTNHFKWILIPYLTSLVFFVFENGMLWAEIMAIESLCLFHGLVIYKLYTLNKKS